MTQLHQKYLTDTEVNWMDF